MKLLPLVLLLPAIARAEVYGGVGAGIAITDVETNCPTCEVYDVSKFSIQPTGFLGLRAARWGVETGVGRAAYRGHAVDSDRPADVRQRINVRDLYVSAMYFHPVRTGDQAGEAFLGLGVARVSARNDESGKTQYVVNGCTLTGQVEHTNWTRETVPFFQVGWQGEHLRVSASYLPGVVKSPWTGEQDVWHINFSYMLRFR